ncbi:hypothetical protein C8Q74DRAFT_531458 [Fomes fomentarius]|nr:hypothetical protein C8Q74DRAFT_531458 [Fomes fomentarius]
MVDRKLCTYAHVFLLFSFSFSFSLSWWVCQLSCRHSGTGRDEDGRSYLRDSKSSAVAVLAIAVALREPELGHYFIYWNLYRIKQNPDLQTTVHENG